MPRTRINASKNVSIVNLICDTRVKSGLDSALYEFGRAVSLACLLEILSVFSVEVEIVVVVGTEVKFRDIFTEED